MPKGYLIVEMTVHDAQAMAEYSDVGLKILSQWGGRVIISNGTRLIVEGEWRLGPMFVIEFDSFEKAKGFYFSPDYQSILPARLAATSSKGILIEGAADLSAA